MELDVLDGRAIHVVLDDAGPGSAQVKEGHEAIGGAHRALQPTLVKTQRCQALPSLSAINSNTVEKLTQTEHCPYGCLPQHTCSCTPAFESV